MCDDPRGNVPALDDAQCLRGGKSRRYSDRYGYSDIPDSIPTSASPSQCAAGTYNWSGYQNDGSQWYDSNDGKCYYGTSYDAVFNFASQNVTLPSSIVYGIAFDASSGPGSSLNVKHENASHITVGGETNPDNLFVAGTQGEIGPGEVTCKTWEAASPPTAPRLDQMPQRIPILWFGHPQPGWLIDKHSSG